MSTLATDPAFGSALRRFDRLFGDVGSSLQGNGFTGTLPVDVTRYEDRVVLEFDLPGIDPDAIEVTVDNRELLVRGERTPDAPEGATRVRHERRHGTMERRVHLGEALDLDGLVADHRHGVLQIVIPIAAAAKPRKVAIGAGAGEDELES